MSDWKRFPYLVGISIAVGCVSIVTVALLPLRQTINSTTIGFAYLATVVLVATFFESKAALTASILAAFSFNFFFLPPYYTLTISDPQDWVALFVFLGLAIAVGHLSTTANRRRAEAERLYKELDEAFDKASEAEALKRSEKLKSALLDAVSHDFRTPLTAIKAAVTTMLEDVRGPKPNHDIQLDEEGRTEFLEIIDEEADRLNNFIGSMVEIAQLEAGQLHLRRAWRSVEDIINNAIQRASGSLATNHIIINKEPELPAVRVDAEAIAEVLYSLLDNAAKYSPEGSKIRISVRNLENGTIEFSVEDQGTGVPEEKRERVFDKFYTERDGDVHATGGGLGLGLSIARGIVESQGGKIWIEDGRDGYKTRVVFLVPIGDEEE
jgi:two-component system sensor histidine kinase KdpD